MKTKKQTKNNVLNFRVNEETLKKIEAISEILSLNKTKSFELAINSLFDAIIFEVSTQNKKNKIESKNG